MFGAVLLFVLLPVFAGNVRAEDLISEGVYIGEMDLGGMTMKEARQMVNAEVKKLSQTPVTITMGEHQASSTYGDLGLTWTNQGIMKEIGLLGTTGNILDRYKKQKDLQNSNVHYSLKYTLNAQAERALVESLAQYNTEPVSCGIYMGDDGMLHPDGGSDGVTLNVETTLATLNEYLMDYQPVAKEIPAEVSYSQAEINPELVENMNSVLGSATTDYSSSSAARAQNIWNATNKINGTLLMPGEAFSVTAAAVPFTAENGYEKAPSYEAGQVVESYGGGICQVSTTLYNALLKAEMDIYERSNHTMTVSYVEPSKDAAIAEGIMDLVFANNKDTPVYIYGSAYYGTLNFKILGVETRPENRTLEFYSEVTGRQDMSQATTLVPRYDQNAGYLVQTQTAHEGLSAVLWKNIYIDGVLQDTIQVNSSYYQPTAAVFEVGVASANPQKQAALISAVASNSLSAVQTAMAMPETAETESETQQGQQAPPSP